MTHRYSNAWEILPIYGILNSMNATLRQFRLGLVALTSIFVLAVVGFRLVGDYDWLESIWLVVVTVSTVGYSEHSESTPAVQLLTIVVILLGVSAAAYTFGGFVQLALQGELDRALGRRKLSRTISTLQNHVIICGFGRLGQDLAESLSHRKIPFVVIDHDLDRIQLAGDLKYPALQGDATSENVLGQARLEHARAIASALPSDADNVFITLTARNLCPSIQIIAKSERNNSCNKLRQAGADKIVMPHRVGAQQMERMITRPSTADLVELFAETKHLDMELDELVVPPGHFLVGITIQESGIRDRFDLLIVGVKSSDGDFKFNPKPTYTINAGDTLLVMGRVDDINRMKGTSDH